jgi:hypothetical protein
MLWRQAILHQNDQYGAALDQGMAEAVVDGVATQGPPPW